jgi:tol-pal system protein YbgF
MTRYFLPILGVAILVTLAPVRAQNRQDLQIQTDLRILTEQVARLQVTVNQLGEQIKAVNGRVDQVADANVKALANQQLSITQVASTLATVRENLSDNTVRVSQLSQEFGAVRSGLRLLTDQLNSLVSLLQPPAAVVDPATGAPVTGAPPSTSSAAPLSPVNLPSTPGSLMQRAMADYFSARYDIAIEGFQELIKAFPEAADAPRAQLHIGESFYHKKMCQQAIPEYQKVVDAYRTSDAVPDALLMLGFCSSDLNRRADAIRWYERLSKEYPDSGQALQARQRLESLRR